ncbi:TIGR03747 family integrating conjugative element membrane protein [Rouxiella badensis]|uniref:TIGR03747 family integrating conjugative element membrane protein n=1 Tax=Rouxiella badensis TaxID=1646377 RepID=UPI001D157500|nr:TIGR03747 family integrating conjugative element membrane protein [Rouxiella badensis]MCC3701659.1 TIGR03747 family integrating conjugative element membrane protein [Rouxiella badensis]
MTQPNRNQLPAQAAARRHGFFYNVLWAGPWTLIGMLLASLLFSLLIEYVGLTFFWNEMGSARSQQVMNRELGYLSSEFTHSLIFSRPAVTLTAWIAWFYQWALVHSGLFSWFTHQTSSLSVDCNGIVYVLNIWGRWLTANLMEYLLATFYVTVIYLVRITILVLSLPLFVLVVTVAIVEGLGLRDLRRYGAGYESSFVYHHAKRLVKPAIYLPCMFYLSWPTAVYPNFLLLPAVLLLGITVTIVTASFKKYL